MLGRFWVYFWNFWIYVYGQFLFGYEPNFWMILNFQICHTSTGQLWRVIFDGVNFDGVNFDGVNFDGSTLTTYFDGVLK